MNQSKYVFAQLVTFLDRNHFNYLARKYSSDRYVKHFTCWNQPLALMFGQFGNRESLRDLITVLEAQDYSDGLHHFKEVQGEALAGKDLR